MAPLQYGGGVCGAGSPVEPGFGMANSTFIGCMVPIMGLPQARNWPMTPLFKLNCARPFLFRTNYCWRFVDRCLKSSPDGWLQSMARKSPQMSFFSYPDAKCQQRKSCYCGRSCVEVQPPFPQTPGSRSKYIKRDPGLPKIEHSQVFIVSLVLQCDIDH